MNVLILGGTTEARELATLLSTHPNITPIFSLAGVTSHPILPQCTIRSGGFGGINGLKHYLHTENIHAVVDATHPFAVQMGHNAASACASLSVPLLRLERPAWSPYPGDHWIHAQNLNHAAQLLGSTPKRVFLTTGRKDLSAFRADTAHHYIIRSIDPPSIDECPQNHTLLINRPPFSLESEHALMSSHKIDILITKNAGSASTAAKLTAARHLKIPVIMVQRPVRPLLTCAATPEAARLWLETL
ncbi:cobalt-precorrin-6A reductase [Neokomagataea thailandica]|uniref:Precorrin 6x reductase n=1 Tax=Neokomagataea tanensis NBRC 106556 TaxID=1223519 RepID=A0ABQ0QI43_9PROT|nr:MULTISPECIES: cobalt-precorrin-6A reductase [Neokomagataea]GBR45614.1 precorrin 6x reductase [Neokomagataea tanensis NBRC 106556]